MKVKSIIFDFDGVILESVNIKTEAFAELYENFGGEIVRKITEHHLANGGINRYDKIKFYHKEFLGIVLSVKQVEFLSLKFSKIVFNKIKNANFVPGAFEFISKYYNSYNLFISSATPESELKEILRLKRINKFFKKIYGYPPYKTDHIKNILNETGFENKEVIYVGDAKSDKIAASENNIKFIARINNPTSLNDELYKVYNLINFDKFLLENFGY